MLYSCFTHAFLVLYSCYLYSCFTHAILVLYSCYTPSGDHLTVSYADVMPEGTRTHSIKVARVGVLRLSPSQVSVFILLYSFYLLCQHKSANTGACSTRLVTQPRPGFLRLTLLALLVQKYKY
jgi:hypothetical protein